MLVNNAFEHNKYLDLPVVNKGHRRNTDKIGIFTEESKSMLRELEPITEVIDYNIG